MNTLQFNENVGRIEDLLFGFAMKLTKNRENAKDLMQETLTKAFAKRDRFKVDSNFKAWSTTIMYNSFINGYRKRKTMNQVNASVEDVPFIINKTSSMGNPNSVILHKELINLIDSLDDDFKVPFLMSYRGFQYDEIAAKLDMPIGTVKSRIFYARKKLRAKIDARYDIDTLRQSQYA